MHSNAILKACWEALDMLCATPTANHQHSTHGVARLGSLAFGLFLYHMHVCILIRLEIGATSWNASIIWLSSTWAPLAATHPYIKNFALNLHHELSHEILSDTFVNTLARFFKALGPCLSKHKKSSSFSRASKRPACFHIFHMYQWVKYSNLSENLFALNAICRLLGAFTLIYQWDMFNYRVCTASHSHANK